MNKKERIENQNQEMNANYQPYTERVKKTVQIGMALAEAIKGLGTVPSGHLYARVMGYVGLDEYQMHIDTLKKAGVVTEKFHELTWVGFKKEAK